MISSFIIDAAGVLGVKDVIVTGYLQLELGVPSIYVVWS